MDEARKVILAIEEYKQRYDHTMKIILSNKQILSRILQRFVPEFRDCSLEDIENKYIEQKTISVSETPVEKNLTNYSHQIDGLSTEELSINEGRIVYDILFKASYPTAEGKYLQMYINIESQGNYYPGYPIESRAVYYAARRFASELGDLSDPNCYNNLEKVYSIWICTGNVPKYLDNTVTLYKLTKADIIGSTREEASAYDFINAIIIRIREDSHPSDEVLELLNIISSRRMSKIDKLKGLEKYQIGRKIEKEVKTMGDFGDYIFAELIEEGMAKGMQQGIEKGMQQGIEKGMEQGMQQGLQQGIEKGKASGYQEGIDRIIDYMKPTHSMQQLKDMLIQAFGLEERQAEEMLKKNS